MKHRCKNCNKLLAIGSGAFEIKCPRCKTANKFRSLTTQNAGEHQVLSEVLDAHTQTSAHHPVDGR